MKGRFSHVPFFPGSEYGIRWREASTRVKKPLRALSFLSLDIQLQYNYNVCMLPITFSWDDKKNEANKRKHNISFEEAQTVFFDENAIEFFDPDHSKSEERFLMLGISYRVRVLVVCHCFRKADTEIRIISARKATKKEQAVYFGGKQ